MGAKSKQILAEIHVRLLAFYGVPESSEETSALEAVIAGLLWQKLSLANAKQTLGHWKKRGPYSREESLRWDLGEISERLGLKTARRSVAKSIAVFLDFLKREYQGDMALLQSQPSTKLRSELQSLSGIGPETADWILLYGLGQAVLAVDIHVYRVFIRHGLAAEEAGYEELQEIAAQFNPDEPERYREFHRLLGQVGREFCRPLAKCESCPLKGVNW